MLDIKEIARGFINTTKNKFGSAKPLVENKARERYSICLECPSISINKNNCTECGCILALKTRSNSKCDLNRW
jgi:hypothetical protein